MFLFSSLPTPQPASGDNPVAGALRDAAGRTGVPFDYLVKTAQRESNLDPSAKAGTSSASGLFQFLEQTWLGLVKNDGARLGMADVAGKVVQSADGRLTIADPRLKAQVLAMRDDPRIAATAAGIFTANNRDALGAALGRPPSEGELYIAHFLGASGAADLVKLASVKPEAKAARYFPDAASANRSVFFEKSGRSRTATEVYHALIAAHEAAGNAARVQLAANTAEPPSTGSQVVTDVPGGKPLLGLFRSLPEGAAAGVSKAWIDLPRRAAIPEGPRAVFFPRGDNDADTGTITAYAAPEPAAPSGAPAQFASDYPTAAVPLPPRKPAAIRVAQAAAGAPLDLLAFMRIKR